MKNRRRSLTAICAVLLLSMILSCASVFAATIEEISTIADLDNTKLGVQTGVLYEDHIKDDIEGEEWFYYKMPNDMILALKSNKIDAYLIEEVGYYAQHYEHPELARLDELAGTQP
ncbi:MAG: transporter substrate-binding domain-containing protein, partial [Clostridia bacterium]|nr:transporter substrate-binding domain-containing protein [Clostridia bacterium]